MTIHYHGTPITPAEALYALQGRHFCVSFAARHDIERCHKIGQTVMLDNGAFSMWRRGKPTNWTKYYDWVEKWISYPTTWAVIPDVIDAGEAVQDHLLAQWPFGNRGSPVWHMDEPIDRLLMLCDQWEKVCIGSSSIYSKVLSDPWKARMDQVFDALSRGRRWIPWIHMLRGMACSGKKWPFASVDSTDIARNHHRPQNTPLKMANRWDSEQCHPLQLV